MRKTIFIVIALVTFLSSCQKEEITVENKNQKMSKNESVTVKSSVSSSTYITDSIIIFVAPAPYPNINGEVQIGMNKSLSYPINVRFKIKDCLRYGNNLISVYYTIPAGQRYLVCDIDEYTKSTSDRPVISDSTSANGTFWVYETSPKITSKMIDVYIQLWNVENAPSNVKVLVDYSILKIAHSFDIVNISYSLKANGTVDLSVLDIDGNLFYKPSTTGGGTNPKDPIGPIDPPSLEI